MLLNFALALLVAQPAPAAIALPEGPALSEAIRARDAELFQLFFLGCDPVRLRMMLTPDFEMYHDRDGVVATNAETFVASYDRACHARQRPDAWRSRRELVASSLNIHPVPGFGAIEDGEHLFYEWQGDPQGPAERAGRLVGRARFTQLWKLTPDGWRVARLFSYAHAAAGEEAPAAH